MRCVLISAVLAVLLAVGCGVKVTTQEGTPVKSDSDQGKAGPAMKDITELTLRPYRGRVVLLELGCVGCEGSEEAFHQMREMAKKFTEGVAFVRVDMGQKTEDTKSWYEKNPPGFDVFGDPSGAVGKALPSQAMPTMYVYGKWGQMRYSGGMDPAKMEGMIEALLAEVKPDDSNFFFKKVFKVGDPCPDFTLDTLEGGEINIGEFREDAKAFMLIFAGTSCPTSRVGVQTTTGFVNELGPEGLKILVVNTGETAESIEEFYNTLEPPLNVLVDADGAVADKYGIDVVPTVVLVGPDGKIAFTSQWNEEAIDQEIRVVLGLMKPGDRKPIASEGTG